MTVRGINAKTIEPADLEIIVVALSVYSADPSRPRNARRRADTIVDHLVASGKWRGIIHSTESSP